MSRFTLVLLESAILTLATGFSTARADPTTQEVLFRAQQFIDAGELAFAAQAYRNHLRDAELAQQEELLATVSLIAVLLDRAQDENHGQSEFHGEAEALLERGIALATEISDYFNLAELLRLKWFMQFQQNSLAGSEQLLLEALKYLEEANATEKQKAPFYTELSYTLILAGEFEEAIAYMRRNVARSLEENDRDQLILDLYVIGDAYLKLGETEVSKRYFLEGIEPLQGELTVDYYDALIKLATIARIEGNAPGALEGHQAALNYFEGTGGYRQIPAQIEIARDSLQLDQPKQARKFADLALSNPRAFTEQRIDANLILLELDLFEDKLESADARIRILDGLVQERQRQTGSEYVHPLRQIEFSRLAISYFAVTKNIAGIEMFGERGISVYQHIGRGLNPFGSIHLAWTSRVEPFISQYILVLLEQKPGRVLEVLETTYSQSLVRRASSSKSENSPSSSDLAKLDNYLAAESTVVDAQTEVQRSDTAENRSRLSAALSARDQARDRYLLGTPGDGNAIAAREPVETAGSELRVPDGQLLLRFYSDDQISFVLVKDADSESFSYLPRRSALIKLIDDSLLSLLADGRRARKGALARLASLLPMELLTDSEYERIVIITDDVTHSVPFAAINIGLAEGTYMALGGRFDVIRTPSAHGYYVGPPPSTPVSTIDPTVVIFADPVFQVAGLDNGATAEYRDWSDSLSRLPNTAKEASEIASLYPTGAVTIYLGNQATAENLMSHTARSAKVLHIATHGYFNPATPDIVGIATSAVDEAGNVKRGFLSLSELLSRPFSSNLVVISGCETMLGRPFPGLGVQSLTQGLIAQGAGAVLGTLWKVPDEATSHFMRRFYEELLVHNGDAAVALTKTRRGMMEQSESADPGFWAAFDLTSSRLSVDQNIFQ